MRKLINNIVFRKQKSRQVGRSGHAPQQRPQRPPTHNDSSRSPRHPPPNKQRPLAHPMFICISSSAFGPALAPYRTRIGQSNGWRVVAVGGVEMGGDGLWVGKTHLYICVQIRGAMRSWRVCGRPDSTG